MRRPRASLASALCLSALFVLSACGSNQPQVLPAAPASTAAPSAAAPADGAASSAPPAAVPDDAATNPNGGYWPAAVNVVDSGKLGKVVVDGEGFTLYRFDNDSAHPPKTTCFDACAQKWPPVLTRNKIVYHGIDQQLLGTIQRSDGTTQVTLAGWPMYRFSGDAKPGDLNGEAVGGTWFSFAPNGKKANGDD